MHIVKEKRLRIGVTVGVVLIYIGILIGWHVYTPREELVAQLPGADNRPEGLTRKADDVVIEIGRAHV